MGGGQASAADLHKALKLAPRCVAADGGAVLALEAGVDLAAVIGDFDSVPAEVLAQVPADRVHHIAEQNSTDFEKALRLVDAPVIVGVGFTGGRLDHQLAALHALARYAHRPCVLMGESEIVLLAPPLITLPCKAGDVVSLVPLAPVTGHSTGLCWPIAGLNFAPGGQNGTSNRAEGPVTLTMDAAHMLLILPRALMPPVVAQLSRPDHARWPVRA